MPKTIVDMTNINNEAIVIVDTLAQALVDAGLLRLEPSDRCDEQRAEKGRS